jgi:hypothetical protein
MSANNGGPAFPLSPEVGKAHFDDPFAYHGMTMRQYYKAAALQGLVAGGGKRPIAEFVSEAASLADALLAEDEEHAKK